MQYYVIKNKVTGEYYRGKGVNRWGKFYNQASIFRFEKSARESADELSRRGESVEVLSITIMEHSIESAN